MLSFGEVVRYVHPLGTPFTHEAGSQLLTHFAFRQQRTFFEDALRALIAVLTQARAQGSSAGKQSVQIAFMISDGRIQEGRAQIAHLVREAEENGILIVMLIVDDTRKGRRGRCEVAKPEDSILNTKVYTGKKGKLFANYLDNYPFPYYLVIRSVQTLPEVLADALTQWFEMINSSSSYV